MSRSGSNTLPRLDHVAMASLLDEALRRNLRVCIVGKPGSGKSDLVDQAGRRATWASPTGLRKITSHPVTSVPADFAGIPYPDRLDPERARFLSYGQLYELSHATEPVLWNIEDLGQARESVQAALMQMLLGSAINGHVLPSSTRIVATTNDVTHKSFVGGMIAALKSRFHFIVELAIETARVADYFTTVGVEPSIVGHVRSTPNVFDLEETADFTQVASPRSVYHVHEAWPMLEMLTEAGQMNLISSIAGNAYAHSFLAYRRVCKQIPDLALVGREPKTFPVPSDPGLLAYIIAYLVSAVNVTTADAIMQYIARLPGEVAASFVVLAIKRSPELVNCNGVLTYLAAHPDISVVSVAGGA